MVAASISSDSNPTVVVIKHSDPTIASRSSHTQYVEGRSVKLNSRGKSIGGKLMCGRVMFVKKRPSSRSSLREQTRSSCLAKVVPCSVSYTGDASSSKFVGDSLTVMTPLVHYTRHDHNLPQQFSSASTSPYLPVTPATCFVVTPWLQYWFS
jgi:hypothetical protein